MVHFAVITCATAMKMQSRVPETACPPLSAAIPLARVKSYKPVVWIADATIVSATKIAWNIRFSPTMDSAWTVMTAATMEDVPVGILNRNATVLNPSAPLLTGWGNGWSSVTWKLATKGSQTAIRYVGNLRARQDIVI